MDQNLVKQTLLDQEAEMAKRMSEMKLAQIKLEDKNLQETTALKAMIHTVKKKSTRNVDVTKGKVSKAKKGSEDKKKEAAELKEGDSISSLDGSVYSNSPGKNVKLSAVELKKKKEEEIAKKLAI